MSSEQISKASPISLGDVVGDLSARIEEQRRARLPSLDPPEGLVLTRAAELAAEAVRGGACLKLATGAAVASVALVARELLALGRSCVLVVPDPELVDRAVGDVRYFCPGARVLGLPHGEASPYADQSPDRASAQKRLSVLSHLARGVAFDALVTTGAALCRKVVPRELVLQHSLSVRVDQELERDRVARQLSEAGYARAGLVEDPGTFALRGSIIDVWSPSTERPVRIELLGDGVLSIKEFDPENQRTLGELREAHFSPARETPLSAAAIARARSALHALTDAVDMPTSKARALIEEVVSGRSFFGADGYLPAFAELEPLFEFLPSECVFVMWEPADVWAELSRERARAARDHASATSGARFPLESFFSSEAEVEHALGRVPTIALGRSLTLGADSELGRRYAADANTPSLFSFDQAELTRAIAARRASGKAEALEPLEDHARLWLDHGYDVRVVARTATQADRIASLLTHRGVQTQRAEGSEALSKGRVWVEVGSLAHGLVVPGELFARVTEEEIFGARAHRRARRREAEGKRARSRAFVEDLKTLSVGDFVVHVEHGVGRYLGLIHRNVGGTTIDLITVEYLGGDKLYLPVYRLNQIEKFAGGEGSPKLDRLGGQTFAKTKARAARAVRQLADDLLKLYAERLTTSRPPLPAADDDYRSFEATFPYEETEDQARAIQDVERDLEAASPMDRLVCGDVGFGKTEVAMRAAFRVAAQGRQVAVLCPTTVLAQQHFLGFSARMAGTPIEVRVLSRFSSKKEQDDTLRGLKAGSVDIVIGTHRLLSKDVHFKSLGLLVVDEEQRFGVTHKERIKQRRTSVDVLTLSATPIPRTLQMAIASVRDMSVITTPPVDRRAIRTFVTHNDPVVLRDAIERELGRSGQVFYVYNRVEGLHERAARLAELVPSARIAVIHGQMNETALERSMTDFVEGHYDILCATAIIESGLDIPRANTIIIDRADMFGLAQLYQLRGRVGRSRERAYCYLVVPPQQDLSDEARSRLEAIERHSELGSGFHVASLDLELRGGGDLLGAEQSGTVEAVGFDLFSRMLEDAVHELRGETVVHEIDPELSIDEEALLPDDYVEDVGVRLSLYKRLAQAEGEGEVETIADELEDRFGPPPEAARRLVRLMRLKTELRKLRALGCEATARSVTIHLAPDAHLDPSKLLAMVAAKGSPYKLSPDMRITRRIAEKDPVKGGLDAADLVVSELMRLLPPESAG